MAEMKLTKNELRGQQNKLHQLEKYLPTLQLKKAMLQAEVNEARIEITACEAEVERVGAMVEQFTPLLSENLTIDISNCAKITNVSKRYENIAGVEVPYFESIAFADFDYSLFDTPLWVDFVAKELRHYVEAMVRVEIAREKKAALEKELREVSIRVNLFEKILIPRCLKNIKKIKIFLGDQQLSAVSQAKIAKEKIEERKNVFQNA